MTGADSSQGEVQEQLERVRAEIELLEQRIGSESERLEELKGQLDRILDDKAYLEGVVREMESSPLGRALDEVTKDQLNASSTYIERVQMGIERLNVQARATRGAIFEQQAMIGRLEATLADKRSFVNSVKLFRYEGVK
jgi:chromosome segregation ATPase